MDVFETHEHEFSELSGAITDAVQTKVKTTTGDAKRRAVRDVEVDLEELRDIVEQMELEIRDMPASERPRMQRKLDGYRNEVATIEKDLRRAAVAFTEHTRNELLTDEENMEVDDMTGSDHRQLLLRNSERVNQTGQRIQEAHRQALEIEQVGISIMDNLHVQRETINHAKSSLDETQGNLRKSMRVANNMARRIVQNRILFWAIISCLVLFIMLMIYLKFFR